MTDQRVIVIGNGPVGQTAALLLARWGIAVTVLDAAPQRELVGSKAICQQRDVLDIWQAVGIGRQIADEGVTWTTARTFYRDRELFAITLPDPGQSAFPPFVNISQSRVEAVLDGRIAAERLIDVRWGHRVVHIEQTSSTVTVRCAGGVEVTADYAVVCAGAKADDLRHTLGVSFDGRSFDDRFLICDIRADMPGWAEERRFYFDPPFNPGRQVLIHQCPRSTFRIDWQVPSDYDLAAEERSGALDKRVRAIIGDTDYDVVWRSVYRFHSRVANRLRVGRVLLAGDCAHLYAPFGARGLNSGVADVENAAWKLAFVLRGWAPDELLDTYHDERHAAALENLAVTTSTMDFLVPHTESQRRHRVAALERAVADPSAASDVDSGRLAEPYWYVDSPLTTRNPARPFAGRPPRGVAPDAGPGVVLPDAPVVVNGVPARLREFARDGILLLAGADVDADGMSAAAAAATSAPVRVLSLASIDVDGAVAHSLAARTAELWVIRPDAHIAAVLDGPTPEEVVAAVRRACGAVRA
ncbi:FAD-dependent monooxygenase [Haloechinothrix salitolerans]|uniref:FAD-dependent monooxygenase n=1 Tax=Haloechinothrix salitolerans TaxID=926830 RepID=A0ABW2C080_9PSEU